MLKSLAIESVHFVSYTYVATVDVELNYIVVTR